MLRAIRKLSVIRANNQTEVGQDEKYELRSGDVVKFTSRYTFRYVSREAGRVHPSGPCELGLAWFGKVDPIARAKANNPQLSSFRRVDWIPLTFCITSATKSERAAHAKQAKAMGTY